MIDNTMKQPPRRSEGTTEDNRPNIAENTMKGGGKKPQKKGNKTAKKKLKGLGESY